MRGLLRVKRVDFVMSAVCLVYLKQQTFPDSVGTSHLCQTQTSARCYGREAT
jgi:hypothetical protein